MAFEGKQHGLNHHGHVGYGQTGGCVLSHFICQRATFGSKRSHCDKVSQAVPPDVSCLGMSTIGNSEAVTIIDASRSSWARNSDRTM